MKQQIAIAFLCGLLAGCQSQYLSHHDSAQWKSTVSPDVLEAWRQHRSYYALVEILDTSIKPWGASVTKEQVLQILGPGGEGPSAHPGLEPNDWIYTSSRKVPYEHHCIITFGDDDKVKEIGWISE